MQKKQTKIAGILLVLCCVLALIVFFQTRPDTAAGEKQIAIAVIHGDGSENTFSYDTDAEYLGEVLTEEGLAEGTEGHLTACSSPPLTAKPQTTAKNSGGASQKTAKWSIPAQTRPLYRIRIPLS